MNRNDGPRISVRASLLEDAERAFFLAEVVGNVVAQQFRDQEGLDLSLAEQLVAIGGAADLIRTARSRAEEQATEGATWMARVAAVENLRERLQAAHLAGLAE